MAKKKQTTVTISHIDADGKKVESGPITMDELKKLPEKVEQMDLHGKVAEYPVDVDSEDFTVLKFTCGSWSVKVREDKLNEASEDGDIQALVQKRLKAIADEYPLTAGQFDEWVERFTKRLEDYQLTG